MYAQAVPEDVLVGKHILQVSATDADIQSNAEITYQLSGNGAESFTINSETGKMNKAEIYSLRFYPEQSKVCLIQGHNGADSLITPFHFQALLLLALKCQ